MDWPVRLRLPKGVRRSQLGFLNDEVQFRSTAYRGLYRVCSVTDDQGHRRWRNSRRCLEDVLDERPSGERMQDFRQPRLHSRAVACGEHDDVYVRGAHLCYTTNILRPLDH